MVNLESWSFRECGVPLHYSQVYFDTERSNGTVTQDNYQYQIKLFVLDSNTWNHLTVCKQIIDRNNWIRLTDEKYNIELLVLNRNTWPPFNSSNKWALVCLKVILPLNFSFTSCEQYQISPGGNTPQSTNYTATCFASRKLSKLDKLDTQDTAGEAETSS